MDIEQYEQIQFRKQAKALSEMNKKCEVCGRIKTHHTNLQAKHCMITKEKGLHQSVDPEKKARMSLT